MNKIQIILLVIQLNSYFSESINFNKKNCSTKIREHEIDQKLTNKHSVKCNCTILRGIPILVCNTKTNVDKPIKNEVSAPVCHVNGFKYNLYESWISSNQRCTRCKCQPLQKDKSLSQIKCSNRKHCPNPCAPGQIVTFKRCCEATCSLKASHQQKPIPCKDPLDPNRIYQNQAHFAQHRPHNCTDLYCVCSMGKLYCTESCIQSDNKTQTAASNSRKYPFGKLCCSRIDDVKSVGPSSKSTYDSFQSTFIVAIIVTVIILVILIFGFVRLSRNNRKRLRRKLDVPIKRIYLSDFERNHHIDTALTENIQEDPGIDDNEVYLDNRRMV